MHQTALVITYTYVLPVLNCDNFWFYGLQLQEPIQVMILEK